MQEYAIMGNTLYPNTSYFKFKGLQPSTILLQVQVGFVSVTSWGQILFVSVMLRVSWVWSQTQETESAMLCVFNSTNAPQGAHNSNGPKHRE